MHCRIIILYCFSLSNDKLRALFINGVRFGSVLWFDPEILWQIYPLVASKRDREREIEGVFQDSVLSMECFDIEMWWMLTEALSRVKCLRSLPQLLSHRAMALSSVSKWKWENNKIAFFPSSIHYYFFIKLFFKYNERLTCFWELLLLLKPHKRNQIVMNPNMKKCQCSTFQQSCNSWSGYSSWLFYRLFSG